MRTVSPASLAGITKRSLKKALARGISEEKILNFIHGDIRKMHKALPKPSPFHSWESVAKRYVHLEEVQYIARQCVRNGRFPNSRKALVLSGPDPALACIPWAMAGFADKFDAYESDLRTYFFVNSRIGIEKAKIAKEAHNPDSVELELINADILEAKADKKYGVIDLDFCNNQIKTDSSRAKIVELVDKVSPREGELVLRMTTHIGRTGNSKADINRHVGEFEEQLFDKFVCRGLEISPYQSSLPMVSMVWLLERDGEQSEEGQQA